MAQNITINGNTYPATPYLRSPKQDGPGMAMFYETSDATASSSGHILSGYSAYGANGKIDGAVTLPTITQDPVTGGVTIS